LPIENPETAVNAYGLGLCAVGEAGRGSLWCYFGLTFGRPAEEALVGDVVALLDRDVYGVGQVDRLLGLSRGTASRWIDGYERRGRRYEPLVRVTATGSETVTWGEFVEARLISEYRRHGVSVFRMRPAIMALREEFGTDYPLAAAQPFLNAAGRELVLRVQRETNLQPSLRFVVRSGQTVLPSLEVQRFQQAAHYDHAMVRRFRIADNVVIDPEYASGEPTITGRRLRVATVAESIAAGELRDAVAAMWDITPQAVDDAVRCSNVA